MNTEEISKKLKKKAIEEGFAVAGIANIPGSSRINSVSYTHLTLPTTPYV